MQALLLVAHGSRRENSNDEVRQLANKLAKDCGNVFPIVKAGFLELAAPLIPDGIRACIADGATSVTVLPYFLNSGRHVVEDIPGFVNSTREEFPDIPIIIAPHVGAAEKMTGILLENALKSIK